MLSSLGGDQFQNLNALFKQGPAGIRALMGEASQVGATMSDENAKAAQRTSGAFMRAWAAIKGAVLSVGEALFGNVESIENISSGIVSVAKAVRTFISENKTLVGIVAAVAAGITAVGGILLTMGLGLAAAATAVSGFVAAIAAIKAVVVAVFSPIGAIIAAVVVVVAALAAGLVALGRWFLKSTESGQIMMKGFAEIFRHLREVWGGIVDAIKSGDLKLAWQIAVAGITVIWKQFLVGLQIAWNKFKDYIVDGAFGLKRELQKIMPDFISGTRQEIDSAYAATIEPATRA
jgi:hypothetical protein